MNKKTYTVLKVTPTALTLSVDGKRKRLGPLNKEWGQFCRDVNDVALGWCHGCEAGVIGDLAQVQWADILKDFPPRRELKTLHVD